MALNLIGTTPVETVCGTWSARAGLAPHQPITTMTFTREHEMGGVFDADLRLRVKIEFVHENTGEVRQVIHEVFLPTLNDTPFAFTSSLLQRACASPRPTEPTSTSSTLYQGPVSVIGGRGEPIELKTLLPFRRSSQTARTMPASSKRSRSALAVSSVLKPLARCRR